MLHKWFLDSAVVHPFYYFLHGAGMLYGCMEVACKEAEWMNGSIVTVFWAWSAEMSWKIWEGVSGCSTVVLV